VVVLELQSEVGPGLLDVGEVVTQRRRYGTTYELSPRRWGKNGMLESRPITR
jgi:hypothetical protein